ncbi:hypothetical protein NE237_024011 [Protea cynaroides]|uniref:Uncharacterized protein n=1 Tax=Protea cynaroides TaxID=273540 RepID=A0A9Q0HCU8_9MAGN|nr:hypothetical protein NE237_024011 [Protea cynaroides]
MGLGSCFKPSSPFDGILVVHLNGFVEDFYNPITVRDLIRRPTKFFISTSEQLLSFKSTKTLPPDTELQMGQVYFLLPFTILNSGTSPVDLAYLSNKLAKVAKRFGSKGRFNSAGSSVSSISAFSERSNSRTERGSFSPVWEHLSSSTTVAQESPVEVYDHQEVSYRSKSWKPILETIIEKSFGRLSITSSLSFRRESFGIPFEFKNRLKLDLRSGFFFQNTWRLKSWIVECRCIVALPPSPSHYRRRTTVAVALPPSP